MNPSKIAGLIMGWKGFVKELSETKHTAECVLNSKDFKMFAEKFQITGMNLAKFFGRINQRAGNNLKSLKLLFGKLRDEMKAGNFRRAGKSCADLLQVLLGNNEDIQS
eukprot:TRINITY_DN9886_c0_g3_i1.p2 TRINITY_DN9886_c0_g3~~TRINITY_DN9886_c0_g3_i1.p2  ORF type:complete len:108 (+),score=31.64 TRINITY_DN9886_c0_g3_i1:401-724(+)